MVLLSPHGVHLYNDSEGTQTVVGRLVPRTILPKAKCGSLRGGTDCSYGLHHNCNVALRGQSPHNATEQHTQIQRAAIFRCPCLLLRCSTRSVERKEAPPVCQLTEQNARLTSAGLCGTIPVRGHRAAVIIS